MLCQRHTRDLVAATHVPQFMHVGPSPSLSDRYLGPCMCPDWLAGLHSSAVSFAVSSCSSSRWCDPDCTPSVPAASVSSSFPSSFPPDPGVVTSCSVCDVASCSPLRLLLGRRFLAAWSVLHPYACLSMHHSHSGALTPSGIYILNCQ